MGLINDTRTVAILILIDGSSFSIRLFFQFSTHLFSIYLFSMCTFLKLLNGTYFIKKIYRKIALKNYINPFSSFYS